MTGFLPRSGPRVAISVVSGGLRAPVRACRKVKAVQSTRILCGSLLRRLEFKKQNSIHITYMSLTDATLLVVESVLRRDVSTREGERIGKQQSNME